LCRRRPCVYACGMFGCVRGVLACALHGRLCGAVQADGTSPTAEGCKEFFGALNYVCGGYPSSVAAGAAVGPLSTHPNATYAQQVMPRGS